MAKGSGSSGPAGRLRSLRDSLQAAIAENSSAFGFSIMITGSLASVAHVHGSPDGIDVLLFAVGGVAAFTVLDLLTSGFSRSISKEPPDVVAHAAAVSFLSVAAAIGAAVGLAHLVEGLLVWPIASFASALIFVTLVGVEMAIAESVEDEASEDAGD